MANDRAFAAAGVTRLVTYEVNDTASLIGLIRHGLAVGLLPASLVDDAREIAFVPSATTSPSS